MARSPIQPKKEQGRVELKVIGKKGREVTQSQYRVKGEKGRTPLPTMNSM